MTGRIHKREMLPGKGDRGLGSRSSISTHSPSTRFRWGQRGDIDYFTRAIDESSAQACKLILKRDFVSPLDNYAIERRFCVDQLQSELLFNGVLHA